MSVDQRLEEAARELRESTRGLVAPGIERQERPPRGWIAFAAVFALVVIGLGLLPLLTGRERGPSDVVAPPTVPATTAATPVTTVPTTVPEQPCSAWGLPLPAEQSGLPSGVAEIRRSIAAAAVSCDFQALEALSGDLLTSFGGGTLDDLLARDEAGEEVLRKLVALLGTRFGIHYIEGDSDTFVWPAAFLYDTWEEIPADDLVALTEIFGEEEMDLIESFGSYAGWRVGIDENGWWRYYLAGD